MMLSEIELLEIDLQHADDLFPIWTDWEVIKYTLVREVHTIDDCKERIRRNKEWSQKNGSLGPFVVKIDNRITGFCGGSKTPDNAYEIFYHIAKAYWGNGIGTKIAEKLIKFAFEDRHAIAVYASAVDKNIASWKILEKLNMKKIGTEKRQATGDELLYKYEITRDTYFANEILS
jgi:ribosomal-protein-alanine N-acetyltransferase